MGKNFVSAMNLIQKSFLPTGKSHSATVIFFHGSGDTGSNLVEWIRFLLGQDMTFGHIKMVFPTAPLQKYTPLDGELSNVWFDRKSISIEAKECRLSLASIYETVGELLKTEIDAGIPENRIIVGGFSMGGALAMHTGFHINQSLAGVFAISSFLNRGSIVYDSLKNRTNSLKPLPNFLMFHGERDMLVPLKWGKETFDNLQDHGVNGTFVPVRNTMHELKKSELLQLKDWIASVLPPLESDLTNKL
ncbi:lysophospholipase-like protein 1 [Phlebotomus papatasi]|uniref:palmitoyl-protein hydrolase n=1 Tax=Phlebotomus papatasi TaxID=29031 RepID=A0A1B0GLV9_PHLPP|nr:lysophospholipase-like protein 1 [Phlebotomus papatasi]